MELKEDLENVTKQELYEKCIQLGRRLAGMNARAVKIQKYLYDKYGLDISQHPVSGEGVTRR